MNSKTSHWGAILATITATFVVLIFGVAVGCGSTEQDNQEEHLGTVASSYTNSSSYVDLLNRLQPFAAYQFDNDNSTLANDTGSPGGHPGQYHYENVGGLATAPVQWVPGIVSSVNPARGGNPNALHVNTPDGNVSNIYSDVSCPTFGNCNDNTKYYGNYVEIPVPNKNRDFNITKGWDMFDDTTTPAAGTWGKPTDGDATSTQFTSGTDSWSLGGANPTVCGAGSCYSKATAPGYWSYGKINGTLYGTQWGQIFPLQRIDSDTSAKVWWDNTATSGYFYPMMLVARYTDGNNYYAAELMQSTANSTTSGYMYLAIVKKQNGIWPIVNLVEIPTSYSLSQQIAYFPITQSPLSYYWNVRFQVLSSHDGTNKVTLRAKAWRDIDTQPSNWLIDNQLDGTTSPATGAVLQGTRTGILMNNQNGNRSNVTFRNYKVQSPGMAISAWIRPNNDVFNGSGGVVDGCTVEKEDYNYPINKMTVRSNYDWAIREYPTTAGCAADNRNDMMATYIWGNAPGAGGSGHLGSGNRFYNPGDPSHLGVSPNTNYNLYSPNKWRHIVVNYDAGGYDPAATAGSDTSQGVTVYLNTASHPITTGARYTDYQIDLIPGDQPVRLGAAWAGANSKYSGNEWNQFNGDLDEVMFFDYELNPNQLTDLFGYHDTSQTLQ